VQIDLDDAGVDLELKATFNGKRQTKYCTQELTEHKIVFYADDKKGAGCLVHTL
jgi:hypothetical protein